MISIDSGQNFQWSLDKTRAMLCLFNSLPHNFIKVYFSYFIHYDETESLKGLKNCPFSMSCMMAVWVVFWCSHRADCDQEEESGLHQGAFTDSLTQEYWPTWNCIFCTLIKILFCFHCFWSLPWIANFYIVIQINSLYFHKGSICPYVSMNSLRGTFLFLISKILYNLLHGEPIFTWIIYLQTNTWEV